MVEVDAMESVRGQVINLNHAASCRVQVARSLRNVDPSQCLRLHSASCRKLTKKKRDTKSMFSVVPQVDHPNIIKLQQVYNTPKALYMVRGNRLGARRPVGRAGV
jgi:hypothetical protein